MLPHRGGLIRLTAQAAQPRRRAARHTHSQFCMLKCDMCGCDACGRIHMQTREDNPFVGYAPDNEKINAIVAAAPVDLAANAAKLAQLADWLRRRAATARSSYGGLYSLMTGSEPGLLAVAGASRQLGTSVVL
jgi:hypothetical protein